MKIFNTSTGEQREIADGSVVPEGFGLRIPAWLCDGVPVAVAGSKARFTGLYGEPSGHRPGFCFDNAPSSMFPAAWRGPGGYSRPEDVPLDSDREYQAFRKRISEAWKAKPPAAADDIEGSLPRVGGWRDGNPQRPPRDVKDADAVTSSESAYREMIRRNEQAWRT